MLDDVFNTNLSFEFDNLNNSIFQNYSEEMEKCEQELKENVKENEKDKNLLKKRKAETERKGRLRKKLAIERLMKENKLLKEKIKSLEKELNENLCIECKKKLNLNTFFQMSTNNMKKYINPIFITSVISIILLVFIFNTPSKYKYPEKLIRKLNSYTQDNNCFSTKDFLLNSNSKAKNLFIRYGDYYSIVYKKSFLNNKYCTFLNLDRIKMFDENELKEEMKPEDHINDVIKLNDDAIKIIGPLKFSLFLNPYFLQTPEFNKSFMNKKDTDNDNGNEINSLFYELEMVGYSRNHVTLK